MLDLFVTGADEKSDKIFVTAGLSATMQSLGYSTGIYKPVDVSVVENNGFLQSLDTAFIKCMDAYIKIYSTYMLKSNSSPLIAALENKIVIEKAQILSDFQKFKGINECFLVDGTFGLATPLNKGFLEEDLIKMLDIPLLLVVSAKSSTINNIILTLNHAKEKEIPMRGVILSNYPENCENIDIKLMPRLIEEYTDTKVLGILPSFNKNLNPNDLITEILNGVDVEAVFNVPIAKLQM